MNPVKKVIAYFLSGLVLLFCVLVILGIWDIIDIEGLISKMLESMLVILVATAVIVFIFAILLREQRSYDDD